LINFNRSFVNYEITFIKKTQLNSVECLVFVYSTQTKLPWRSVRQNIDRSGEKVYVIAGDDRIT